MTSLWKQIQNLKSKETEEYERKMKVASDSTIISIRKLEALCDMKEVKHGHG